MVMAGVAQGAPKQPGDSPPVRNSVPTYTEILARTSESVDALTGHHFSPHGAASARRVLMTPVRHNQLPVGLSDEWAPASIHSSAPIRTPHIRQVHVPPATRTHHRPR